jgi:hypothetical protein
MSRLPPELRYSGTCATLKERVVSDPPPEHIAEVLSRLLAYD